MGKLVYMPEQIQEPNLLVPMQKPIGPVQLADHQLTPDWVSLIRERWPREMHSGVVGQRSISTYDLVVKAGALVGSVPNNRNHSNIYWGNLPLIGTSEFSVFFVGACLSGTEAGDVFSNSIGSYQWGMRPNTTGVGSEASAFTFYTYQSSFVQIGVSNAFVSGRDVCFVGVRRASGVELWSGGQMLGFASGTPRNVDAGKVGNVGLGWNLSQTWSNLEYTHWGRYDMVGMYSRGLSPSEAASLSADPYQFFRVPA